MINVKVGRKMRINGLRAYFREEDFDRLNHVKQIDAIEPIIREAQHLKPCRPKNPVSSTSTRRELG
jgi:hypothetical protein